MRDQERISCALAAKLREHGIGATATGAGVNWKVTCEGETRRALVHCFWYERAIHRLMLGINPSNARANEALEHPPPYEGPEYFVVLGAKEGRTRDEAEAIQSVRAWLDGASGEEVVRRVPFVDAVPRALREIASTLDPRLRPDIEGSLWLDERDRTCEVRLSGTRFLYGQQPIAIARPGASLAELTRSWLLDRATIRELVSHDEIIGEKHAELIEIDPARWHWAHVRDRVDNPDDVLAPLRAIIEAFTESPFASRFFSFSSMNRFCFSASSHYGWVNDGLPVVTPWADGYMIDRSPCDLVAAVARVEATLRAYPIAPFFGNAADHSMLLLNARLSDHGLVASVVQRRGWRTLVVRDGSREFSVPAYAPIEKAVAATLAFFAS